MAGDGDSQLQSVLCKKCKNRVINGQKCTNCGASYHPGCASRIKKVKIINEHDVICCSGDVPDISDSESLCNDDNHSLIQEVKYLKLIIEQKDIIIAELRQQVKFLNDNITLRELIDTILPTMTDGMNKNLPPLSLEGKGNTHIPSIVVEDVNINKSSDKIKNPAKKVNLEPNMGNTSVNTPPSETDEQDFTLVQRKKAKIKNTMVTTNQKITRKNSVIIGRGNTSSIKSIPKMGYIHLSRFPPVTTVDDIVTHCSTLTNLKIECEKLQSKKPEIYSSFKVSVPIDELDNIMSQRESSERNGFAGGRLFDLLQIFRRSKKRY